MLPIRVNGEWQFFPEALKMDLKDDGKLVMPSQLYLWNGLKAVLATSIGKWNHFSA